MRAPWRLLLVLLVPLAVGGPLPVLAQLAPGEWSTVQADGDGLILRDGPGYDAAALDLIPDGSTVEIIGGPFYSDDGTAWFEVWASGQRGYVVGLWLSEGRPGIGPGQSSDVQYLAGEWCGPDGSWYMNTLHRRDLANQIWSEFKAAVYGGAEGFDLNPYLDSLNALLNAQFQSAYPPAGQAMQDAYVTLLDTMAYGAASTRQLYFASNQTGEDYDEIGSFELWDGAVVSDGWAADSASIAFAGECIA